MERSWSFPKVFEEREILLAMREEGSILDHVDKKKLSHFHDVVLNEQGNLISFTGNPQKILSATRHSVIMGSQLAVFEAFGISVPEECKPISRRKKEKKNSRI